MKRLVFLSIFCFFVITNVPALIGYVDTENFTLDTVNPVVDIIAPDGGEAWYIGDSNDILWTAEDTNMIEFPITIWYRLGSGEDFIPIVEDYENSGSYAWEIPAVQSYNVIVLIKAIDSFGNYTEKTSQAPFSITHVPPATPGWVDLNVSNGNDAVITWEQVTETIYGTPITPDGYIILYNETPYEDDQFYYYLWDVTEGTAFTHQGVVRHRDQMFYRVVAYKDYDDVMANILAGLRQIRGERILWLEALKAHRSEGGGR